MKRVMNIFYIVMRQCGGGEGGWGRGRGGNPARSLP